VPVAEFLELPAINLLGQNPQRLVSLLLVTDATQGVNHPLPAVPHLHHHHDVCLRLNAQQPRYPPIRTGCRLRYGLVLTTRMPGTSVIPPEPDPERLRAPGAAAARISSIELTPVPALPVRSRPIEAEDFAAMRREQGAPDLLRAAEAAVAATRPDDGRPGLVHGDLWHGNTLWDGGRLTAVLDWDCAGVGPAGIDLGSLRCDAAWCHGRLARLSVRGVAPSGLAGQNWALSWLISCTRSWIWA
jgi:hypothetical protein